MRPISAVPSSEAHTENRIGDMSARRGWKWDLCLSLVGLVSTLVVVVMAVTDARNVVLLPALAFSIPLIVFPWFEYMGEETRSTTDVPVYIRVTARLDLGLSSVSFLAALVASWGLVVVDVHDNKTVAGFQPTMWPVDAFHFVALSFVSALVCRASPNEWYELFGIVLGVVASLLTLLTVKSFTDEWYVGDAFTTKVYGGTTEPFPDIRRVTHASTANREMFYGRFGCAIACVACELGATVARTVRFSLSRCGREDKTGKPQPTMDWSKLVPFDPSCFRHKPTTGCAVTGVSKIVSWIVVFGMGMSCILTLSPYPRWVVYDSRHVATIAALAYFATPQGVATKTESFAAIVLLVLGVFFSTWTTVRTFDLVLRTLSNTAGSSTFRLWSRDDYENEFVQGSASFGGVYQYAGYDYSVVPAWFAATSVLTHALDLATCAAGAGILASVGSDWVRVYGPDVVTTLTRSHGGLCRRKDGRGAE